MDVTDIKTNVFKKLLHYIYVGQVPSEQMEEVAVELLAAADITNTYLKNSKRLKSAAQ